MANPLRPEAILQAMAEALPTHAKDDTTSDLSSSYEALALFTHVCMTSLGFRLLGFNEDKKIESECKSLAPRLPTAWNATFNSHSFLYAHTQSALTFIIKIDRLGAKAAIRGLGQGDERIHSLDVSPRDYISSAALPVRITTRTAAEGADGGSEEDRTDLTTKLAAVFISKERMADLAALLKINIIQKLIPSLQKEGYQEEGQDEDARAVREDLDGAARRGNPGQGRDPPPLPLAPPRLPDDPARPHPFDDPLAAPRPPPARPIPDFPPPGFEDEYEINRPPRGGPGGPGGHGLIMPGGRSPFNIGHDDLNPPGLGPHDPLRASFIGGGGGGGLPRPGGGFGGGGMHPTFDDPLFGGPRGDGGGGFDPQVPPGARFDDPTGGFGGLPRFGGGRPGGRGGGGFNPFGGGGDII